jgi:hypothetical protein
MYDSIYLAWWRFLEAFLPDTSVRTTNPWEANMFYVPALAFYYSGNVGEPSVHIKRVIK